MNVLILAKNSEAGGLLMHTRNLAFGLIQQGHKAMIASSPGEGLAAILKGFPVQTVEWGTHSVFSIVRNYRSLSKMVSENNIDIIHANNRIPALYASFYCFFHGGVKYLWGNHLTPLKGGLLNRCMTHYGCFAVAEATEGARMLHQVYRIPERKIRIVNLGVDLSNFRKTSDAQQKQLKAQLGLGSEVVIMLYGRLCENKGHLFLLDSISHVTYGNYKLIFPGRDDNYIEIVREKAKKYGLSDKIIYPGYINGVDYLSISDLMVLPSLHEGFPQACIEAYAMGVPVIRTKSGGYEDTEGMCFGVDYGDVSAFSILLQSFFVNREMFVEKANYAKNNVNRFSIESMTSQYLSLYRESINKK